MRNGDIMKTIGMAAAAFLVACGASAAHGVFERGGNTKDSPMCACISSEGLLNQDKFHFDRASAEELGRRFYAAWKELAKRPI